MYVNHQSSKEGSFVILSYTKAVMIKMNKVVIFLQLLYWCETWLLTNSEV